MDKILDKFEKACNISLASDIGLEFFSQVDRHIDDLKMPNAVITNNESQP